MFDIRTEINVCIFVDIKSFIILRSRCSDCLLIPRATRPRGMGPWVITCLLICPQGFFTSLMHELNLFETIVKVKVWSYAFVSKQFMNSKTFLNEFEQHFNVESIPDQNTVYSISVYLSFTFLTFAAISLTFSDCCSSEGETSPPKLPFPSNWSWWSP